MVDAERSLIGWIAAAIPALGFLVMVKIALSQGGPRQMVVTVGPSCSCAHDPATTATAAATTRSPEDDHAENEALVAAAHSAAAVLDRQDRRVTRQALADILRAEGHAVSNARASTLLRILKAEAPSAGLAAEGHRFQQRPRGSANRSRSPAQLTSAVDQPALFRDDEVAERRAAG